MRYTCLDVVVHDLLLPSHSRTSSDSSDQAAQSARPPPHTSRGLRLGDAGAVALADGITSSARLAELRLAYNAIGDVGAAALSRSLIANNVLTELYLWRNKIGDVGAKALCNALASNRRLALLDLRWNKIKHAVDVFTSNTENRTCWNSSPMFRHLLQRDPANCALTWNIGHSEL